MSEFSLPAHRVPIRALNHCWGALQAAGIGKPALTRDALVRAARKASGLSDLGTDFDLPVTQDALRRLLESLEGEANLHPFGRMVIRGTIVGSLSTRLQLEALAREHAEIPAMPIESPVFIAGLARTGTTLLHRLLGCEPRLRPLASWEGLSPAPLPGAHHAGRDPRIKRAERAERALQYLAPEFFAIHPVEADGLEEDVLLQDGSFMSPTVDATMSVPTYSAWLHETDQSPMYRYFRRLVQLLLWQRPGTYLGKTPHHLENLPTLLEVFPDYAQSARSLYVHWNLPPELTEGLLDGLRKAGLDVPVVWMPHSYSGCNQHGADEHGLKSLFREGLGVVAGLYWDLGEGATPKDG